MASKTYLQETDEEEVDDEITKSRKVSVYDAVAKRISASGFIPRSVIISSNRDTASTSLLAVSPENVLFRGKNAFTRYAEKDVYFANEDLSVDLPDSDLLKAIHRYVADFYARATLDGGEGDWRSMDETALMALGILMEESSREILGQTGDLTFTEGEEEILEESGSNLDSKQEEQLQQHGPEDELEEDESQTSDKVVSTTDRRSNKRRRKNP